MEQKGSQFNNVVRIPTSYENFFRAWVEMFTPLHELTNREKDILAAFIEARFEIATSVKDETLINNLLESDEIKNKIKQKCGVSNAFFSGILGKLRKEGILNKGVINPLYIPKRFNKENKYVGLLFYFDLKDVI